MRATNLLTNSFNHKAYLVIARSRRRHGNLRLGTRLLRSTRNDVEKVLQYFYTLLCVLNLWMKQYAIDLFFFVYRESKRYMLSAPYFNKSFRKLYNFISVTHPDNGSFW